MAELDESFNNSLTSYFYSGLSFEKDRSPFGIP